MLNLNLVFYDFEVKKDGGCCTFLEEKDGKDVGSTITDRTDLIDYVLRHKDNSVFIGYNNIFFDNYCMKAIGYGLNPYCVVQHCIKDGEKPGDIPGMKFKKNLNINSFDLMRVLGRNAPPLKEIEGCLGLEIIIDDTIANNKEEGLTKEELRDIVEYNKHDVFTTRELFKIVRYEYDAIMLLIDHYNLPIDTLKKSKASMLETIYQKDLKHPRKVESFKYKTPSFIKFYDNQVKDAIEAFDFTETNKFEYDYQFEGNIYKIGRGGAHYAKPKLYIKLKNGKILVCADFGSFYPNMMANKTNSELRFIDESLPWQLFGGMIDLRMEEKKKKSALANALKIPLNGAYGKLIDKFSKLYNGTAGLSVCLTGQLITVMICQELQKQQVGELVNVNTDGFYYLIDGEDKLEKFENIMKAFEVTTGISFSYDIIKNGVFSQKDVNNYVIADFDTNHIKVKGAMVNRFETKKKWFMYSQAIVDEAVVNKLVYGTPIRKTILDAYNKNEAIKFQIITSMRKKNGEGCFLCGSKNDEETGIDESTGITAYVDQEIKEVGKTEEIQAINRSFAVADITKPRIGKLKESTYHKFSNTPSHIMLYNKSIKDFDIRTIGLNIEGYCKLAQKRVEAFIGKKDV